MLYALTTLYSRKYKTTETAKRPVAAREWSKKGEIDEHKEYLGE